MRTYESGLAILCASHLSRPPYLKLYVLQTIKWRAEKQNQHVRRVLHGDEHDGNATEMPTRNILKMPTRNILNRSSCDTCDLYVKRGSAMWFQYVFIHNSIARKTTITTRNM